MFEAWSLRSATVYAQEDALRIAVRDLPDASRHDFYKRYSPQLKDPDTYAALNWFFISGLHNFYLKQWFAGLFDLFLMVTGVVLLFSSPGLGLALLMLVSLMELPALFRSQILVTHYNTELGWQLLSTVRTTP